MYILSKDGEKMVNSDNVKCFYAKVSDHYKLFADNWMLGTFPTYDDAKKALYYILNQIEAGATSYQV